MKPLMLLQDRAIKNGLPLFSLDLSAATDRLRIDVQVALHSVLFGKEFANSWKTLLVDRPYKLTILTHKKEPKSYFVKYGCGQPMGAYSSWNSLALTHHLVVQFCAYKAGVVPFGTWFTDYAVCGDDIVIANAAVAKEYLRVMKVLGIGIGLHKSLISPAGSCMEFCKKTFWRGKDISPIRVTELQAAFSQPAGAKEFMKKYQLSLAVFIKVAGYKYGVLGKLGGHFNSLNSKVKLIILTLNVPTTVEEAKAFFSIGNTSVFSFFFETIEVLETLLEFGFENLKSQMNKSLLQSHFSTEGRIAHLETAADYILKLCPSWAFKDWSVPDFVEDASDAFNAIIAEEAYSKRRSVLLTILQKYELAIQFSTRVELFTEAMKINQFIKDVLKEAENGLPNSILFSNYILALEMYSLLPIDAAMYHRLIEAPNVFNIGVHIKLWRALRRAIPPYQATPKGVVPPKEESGLGNSQE